MATTVRTEDRVLDVVHELEVAAIDTGREFTKHMSEMVPVMTEELAKVADTTFAFTSRVFELQLELVHKLFMIAREHELLPAAPKAVATKKSAPTKRAAPTKKAA